MKFVWIFSIEIAIDQWEACDFSSVGNERGEIIYHPQTDTFELFRDWKVKTGQAVPTYGSSIPFSTGFGSCKVSAYLKESSTRNRSLFQLFSEGSYVWVPLSFAKFSFPLIFLAQLLLMWVHVICILRNFTLYVVFFLEKNRFWMYFFRLEYSSNLLSSIY